LRDNNKNREDPPMDVVPLGPGFAAELRGVTLQDVAADDVAYAATRTAFEEHSVLVLRDQEVTDELQVEGMEVAAGKKLIDKLMEAATAPGTSYLHQWRGGDVVMWDNRATMHRGRPWPAHEARLMIRTTISATEADGVATLHRPLPRAAE
jgi:alpha-ketoglutarate-dependent taurine dioxygenase